MRRRSLYCAHCGIVKTLENTNMRTDRNGFFMPTCKKCTAMAAKKRYSEWYLLHKQEKQAQNAEWWAINAQRGAAYAKQWRSDHRQYQANYQKNRCKIDPNFKIAYTMRKRICTVLKIARGTKIYTASQYVGCPIHILRSHLESLFSEGMTWENHGEWHIDHIRPCASFDLTDPEQQRQCFHYTNLQPLWAKDNLRKGARIIA